MRLSMAPSALVPSAERLFRQARILLVADDPVLSDGLVQELRAHGCAVGITNPDGRGLDRLDFLDPQVVLIDAPGSEHEPRVLSRIQGHIRFRWAAVPLEFRWSIIWPPFIDRPDMVALGKIVEPFTALDRAVRAQSEKGTAFTVPLERIGLARAIRAMAGATPDVLLLELESSDQAGRIEVSGDLVVGAALWATADPDACLKGIEALGAMLRIKVARGQVRRRTFAQEMNIMSPVGEALTAAQTELLGPVAAMTRETRREEAEMLIAASKEAAESKEITLRVETPESRIKKSVPPDKAVTYDISDEDTEAGAWDTDTDPTKTAIDGPKFIETVIDSPEGDDDTTQKFALDEAAGRVEKQLARVKKARFELEMDETETRRDIRSVRPEQKRKTDPGVAPPSDHSELSPLRPVSKPPSSGSRSTRGFSTPPPAPPASSVPPSPPRVSSVPPPPPAPNSGLVRMLRDSKAPSAPPAPSAADSTVQRRAFDATPMPQPLAPPPPVETPPPPAPPLADAAGAHPAVEAKESRRGIALAIGGLLVAALLIGGFAYVYPSLTEASTGDAMIAEPLQPIPSHAIPQVDPVLPPEPAEAEAEGEAEAEAEADAEAGAEAVAEAEAGAEAEADADADAEADAEAEVRVGAVEVDEAELPNTPAVFTPDEVSGDRDRARADALLARAADARMASRLRLLHAAALADEVNPHAAEALARHFVDASQLDAAEAWAREAVRLRRRRARYRVLLGDVLLAKGNAAEARQAYEQALEIDPDDRDAAARLR